MKQNINVADWILLIILIVGGINWGLVGVFDFNLVTKITAGSITIERIVYILVGLSSLYAIYFLSKVSSQ